MERRIRLKEFETVRGVPLSHVERDALAALHPGLTMESTYGTAGRYDLTPDQHVGMVVIRDLVLEIRPKVPVASAAFLISYACELIDWDTTSSEFTQSSTMTDVVGLLLARAVTGATRRGLLHGYQTVEENVASPSGRICFDTKPLQVMMSPPVPVRRDEWTADITENRLLLAAATAISRLPVSGETYGALLRARSALGHVSAVEFGKATVPTVTITRLNKHYEAALGVAALALKGMALDLGTEGPRASAFLVDMNKVFERFVRRGLRRAAGLSMRNFPDSAPSSYLDETSRVPLEPDLCLVNDAGRVVWVADAKYKLLPGRGYINADVYQLLAYCVGHGLRSGHLIYAADAGARGDTYVIRNLGTEINVHVLDLSDPVERLKAHVGELAAGLLADSCSVEGLRVA